MTTQLQAAQYVSSDELHHFALRALKENPEDAYLAFVKIIQSGHLRSKVVAGENAPITITIDWAKPILSGLVNLPNCVCFCDIPVRALAIHTAKYGRFGLSFRREHLRRYGARPVLYVPCGSDDHFSVHGATMLGNWEAAFRSLDEHLPFLEQWSHGLGEKAKSLQDAARMVRSIVEKDIFGFLKPFRSALPDDDPDQFYMEREWRLLGSFRFCIGDLTRVFVPRAFVDRLRNDLTIYRGPIEGLG